MLILCRSIILNLKKSYKIGENMIRTDDMYGDYPTLEEIKRDYNEFLGLIGSIYNERKSDRLAT